MRITHVQTSGGSEKVLLMHVRMLMKRQFSRKNGGLSAMGGGDRSCRVDKGCE